MENFDLSEISIHQMPKNDGNLEKIVISKFNLWRDHLILGASIYSSKISGDFREKKT